MADQDPPTRSEEVRLPPVEKILGHLIRRAQQRHTQYFAEEFGGDLTGPQFAILSVLADGRAAEQGTVGRLASLDRSTTGDVVARLERNGWLRRRRDPDDSRRALLELSAASRAALAIVTARVAAVQERLLAPLTVPQRTELLRLLRDIAYAGVEPEAAGLERAGGVGLDLATTPGHLLRRAEQVHDRLWARELESGLTPSQYAILAVLATGPLGQVELGAGAALDRSSTADILARLRRRKLVASHPDPADRRRNEVSLTAAGRRAFRDAVPRVLEVQEELVAPLGPGEGDVLVDLLAKVAY